MRCSGIIGALAMAWLPACGGGEGGGDITQPGNRPGGSVSIVERAETKGTAAFNPNPQTVSVASGGVVSWYNDDEVAAGGEYGGTTGTIHNIAADDLSFSSGNIVPRARYQQTFQTAGDYPYHCAIHPTMKGTITVTP